MAKRDMSLCEKCKNFRIKTIKKDRVERGPRTYTCSYCDYSGSWSVWVDEKSYKEKEYPTDNCFDKDPPPK